MKKVIKINESQLHNIINNIIEQASLLNEDAILFRKMTLKTKFSFGKYRGQTVEDVIRSDHPVYLRSLYYGIEGITFTDDILEKIGVLGNNYDYRIKKPGKNRELGDKVDKIKMEKSSPSYRREIKNIKLRKLIQHKNADKTKFTKRNLQQWNQGHK
jgi:hypothetical protein